LDDLAHLIKIGEGVMQKTQNQSFLTFFKLTLHHDESTISFVKKFKYSYLFLLTILTAQTCLQAARGPSSWYPHLIQARSAKFKFDYPPITTFTDRFDNVEFGREDAEEM